MKKAAVITLVVIACILVPNLMWLANSTTRITNAGKNTLSSIIVHVNDSETKLGELHAGNSRFIFLPKVGDATYKVSYRNGPSLEAVCQEYVEGHMYHVETTLTDSQSSECKVSLPLVSELFILKVL